jgi:hypothetical protein
VYQLYGVPFFIWNSSQFGQPLPQLAIDWEDSSADAHFFLERAPADRRNTFFRSLLARLRNSPHSLKELSHGLMLPARRIAPIVKELLAAGAIIRLILTMRADRSTRRPATSSLPVGSTILTWS